MSDTLPDLAGEPVEYDDRRWWTLGVLCLSLFMVVMGNTVLNVALPTLADELQASGSQLQWIVDAYSLVFAGLLFTAGALGDRYGRKGALNVGLVIFGLASLSATFGDSAAVLIWARAVMGLGAALVMPATLSILTHTFPPEERSRAIGMWAGIAGAAAAIGPLASGYLLRHFSWQSVFYLNVPVVIAALVFGYLLVPTSRHPDRVPLDPIGAGLSIAMISSLVYGIIQAPEHGWSDPLIVGAFAVALVSGSLFAWWELRSREPMLDLRFFRKRGFSGGSLAITMVFFGMYGMFFVLTQYLQQVRGYDPLGAAVRTLPMALSMMVTAPLSARVVGRFGTRNTVSTGMFLAATGLLLLSFCGVDTPYVNLIPIFVIGSVGMGLTMAPSTTAIMSSLPQWKAGVGSAVNDTTRELGGSLGVAVLGSVLAGHFHHKMAGVAATVPAELQAEVGNSLGDVLRVAPRLGERAPEVIDAARLAFVDGMQQAVLAGAVIAYVGAAVVLAVLPRRLPAGPAGLAPDARVGEGEPPAGPGRPSPTPVPQPISSPFASTADPFEGPAPGNRPG
jgi:EmrB/QacA subfamily drug resistance transporter